MRSYNLGSSKSNQLTAMKLEVVAAPIEFITMGFDVSFDSISRHTRADQLRAERPRGESGGRRTSGRLRFLQSCVADGENCESPSLEGTNGWPPRVRRQRATETHKLQPAGARIERCFKTHA